MLASCLLQADYLTVGGWLPGCWRLATWLLEADNLVVGSWLPGCVRLATWLLEAGYLAVEALQPELGELCVLAVLVVHPPLLSHKSGTQYQSD